MYTAIYIVLSELVNVMLRPAARAFLLRPAYCTTVPVPHGAFDLSLRTITARGNSVTSSLLLNLIMFCRTVKEGEI